MSKPKKPAKKAKKHTVAIIAVTWLLGIASLGLVYFLGTAVASDMSSFRSCADNNTGLVVNSCGKAGLNAGDYILITLFILSGCMVVSFITGAWRMTRRNA